MESIRAVIVDDEPEAIEFLGSMIDDLSQEEDIRVIAGDTSAASALNTILKLKPEIVFLDIDMPGKNGFELAEEIVNHNMNPAIIFVTAFDKFAVRAIRHSAFDFLLKPVDPDELRLAISRYKKNKRENNLKSQLDSLLHEIVTKRLKFNTRTGFVYCHADDILYAEAHGSYSNLICSDDNTITVSMNIGSLEEFLSGKLFIRINRSVIINRRYIREVSRRSKTVVLRTDKKTYRFHITSRYIRKLESED